MSGPQKQRSPGGNRGVSQCQSTQGWQRNSTIVAARGLQFWRDRLPHPTDYYRQHVARLGKPNPSGWAQGRCPFHDDSNSSLSVHLSDPRGGWRCFAGCGGGDLVAFHMRCTGKPFRDSVRDLLRGDA